jgi:hypothetical protein
MGFAFVLYCLASVVMFYVVKLAVLLIDNCLADAREGTWYSWVKYSVIPLKLLVLGVVNGIIIIPAMELLLQWTNSGIYREFQGEVRLEGILFVILLGILINGFVAAFGIFRREFDID